MLRQHLTLSRIAAFNPKSEGFIWDDEMHRLALRARPSGAKSFIFKGTLKYKEIKITIGDAGAMTIDDARKAARQYQQWIDEGKDPREVLRQRAEDLAAEEAARQAAAEAAKAEAERRATPALEAWNAYIEARRSKWGELTLRDHERMGKEGGEPHRRGRKVGQGDKTQPGVLRPLLTLPLDQINAERVRAWLAEESPKRPAHVALAYRLLRAFLNWCADRPEYADRAHPKACQSRMVREEVPKKRAKDDCLQREQLPLWFEKVRSIPNPVIASYLQTTLLTGARREEVAGLRWDDIDFQWRTIRIADKVEGERTIPLTPYVAGLLSDLKARSEVPPPRYRILHGKRIENDLENWKPSPWVFSSPTAASGRLQEPRVQHKAACAAAGIDDLTIHGLRRSFGTLAEWVECPAGVVAQIQGHKPSATAEKHYRRRPIDLLRLWHTRIESWILEQAGIKQPSQETAPGLRVISV